MTIPILPSTVARQELEDSWRLRLEEVQDCYRAAEQYRRELQEHPDRQPQYPEGSWGLARQAESEALAEYTRVLRIFTELTLQGRMPEEESSASSDDT